MTDTGGAPGGVDDLTITVGGKDITGWQTIEVTLRAEGFPNSFAISMSAKDPIPEIARAGADCVVKLGADKVVTGFVDRDRPGGSPTAHSIELIGRGKTQDLVDCSAEWPIGQLIGGNALTIAQTVAKPYGLTVKLAEGAATGDEVPKWNLNFGETGAEIIQRVARNAGLLAYEDADGALLLAAAGTRKAASGIVFGENVEQWSAENSMDARFSEIVCCGASMNVLMELGGDDFYHKQPDPNVKRHRLFYMVVEQVADDPRAFTIKKAKWEVARRAGRSAMVRATIDSWRDKAGKLWAPNTLVPVEVPGNRGGDELCVSEVTFRRSNEAGTTAELMLMPKEAFTPEPIVLEKVNTADIATAP